MCPWFICVSRLWRMSTALLGKSPRDQRPSKSVDYRIASARAEWEAAFKLIHSSYLRAGLSEPNAFGMRITPYHLLDTTDVLIAIYEGEPILTMTLVGDGDLGLPLESIYSDEVAIRRAMGRAVAEVSCLADRRLPVREFCPVFVGLSRLCAQYARFRGYDDLLIAVHPKHARLYRRLFGFEPIGPLRVYPAVRNRPAVALCLDLVRLPEAHPDGYRTLFGVPIPQKAMRRQTMPAQDIAFFGAMIDPTFHAVPLGPDDQDLAVVPMLLQSERQEPAMAQAAVLPR